MKNILISGALGFLGSNLSIFLAKNFPMYNIIAIDNEKDHKYVKNKQKFDNFNNILYIKGDLKDNSLINNILNEHKSMFNRFSFGSINSIYAFAFDSNMEIFDTSSSKNLINNVYSTINLGIAAINNWQSLNDKNFIYVSSTDVYGFNETDSQFNEESKLMPSSLKGSIHAANELILQSFHFDYNLPVTIFRISNFFGPGCQHKNIPTTILKNIFFNNPITLNISKHSIINVIFYDDLIYGLEHGLKIKGTYDIFNLGGENIPIIDFVEIAITIAKYKFNRIFDNEINYQVDKNNNSSISIDKTYEILGWKNYTILEEAIEKTFAYFASNYII
ncbi:NAD(P)-dependent oxidoreductase [Deferribacter autotrophicus]|uniref:NAD(P)-dependent oxidoreductase n=1 Tax=Deferribacter autotrophicus TaxID=500465 RepID=A0A5A8F7E5_9BACT|nr:NAD(P)-dependent oxidoreductase [Deferribacter autotrophicus]KAA0258047.1 NAD(P)-dependent oxidoreductase [Deferribacter autotrophicus]